MEERVTFLPLRFSRLREIQLNREEIQVWSIPLDQPPERVAQLKGFLSLEERERAERFHFEEHRRRHIVHTALLRHLLANCLGIRPDLVAFRFGAKGKPVLKEQPQQSRRNLHFNASHSNELAVHALCYGRELGVDVEYLRPLPDALSIAKRFFAPDEFAELERVDEASQVRAFFNCWTRKEAFIKAIGDGLSKPLHQFNVSLLPGQPSRMLSLDGSQANAALWALHHFIPGAGYVGAVAIRQHGLRLRGFKVVWD